MDTLMNRLMPWPAENNGRQRPLYVVCNAASLSLVVAAVLLVWRAVMGG